MIDDQMLEKTNRMNLLFDFYHELLTEKQQIYLQCYFHEDFSLSEIAEQFHVSRQAIFEHVKRAEAALEHLESKLQLVNKHESRERALAKLEGLSTQIVDDELATQIQALVAELRAMES